MSFPGPDSGGREAARNMGMKTGKLPVNAMKRSVFGQIRRNREEVLNGAGFGEDCAIFSFRPEVAVAVCVQEAVVALDRTSAASRAGRRAGDATQGEKQPGGLDAELTDVAAAGVQGAADAPQGEKLPGEEPRGPRHEEAAMSMADLIVKCANNLAAGGAEPVAATVALLLPETVEEPQVRALMAQAQETCTELHMEIIGGQTRVTAAAAGPLAVVTGYGAAARGESHGPGAAAPGQDIVLSKWIGLQGTALLARRFREKLLARYPAWLVEEAAGFGRYLSVLPEARVAREHGVCAMHDASEGGILGALWELAEGAGLGLEADLRGIPLRQETVEVCECCGANPYELLCGGCLVMTARDGHGLAAALEAAHIPATVIGKLTGGRSRILRCGEEIRYLDRPRRDAVYQMPEPG